MAYLLDRIKESLAKEGLTPRTNQARVWLKRKVDEFVFFFAQSEAIEQN
jgi:hypothetical protein